MKSIILLLILAFFSPAQAQMACMDLFAIKQSRPSEKEISVALFELKYLLSQQYSKDPKLSFFTKSESKKKLSELREHFTESQIKERLRKIKLENDESNFTLDSHRKKEIDTTLDTIEKNTVIENILKRYARFSGENIHDVFLRASEDSLTDLMQTILGLGIDVNSKIYDGKTALHAAAQSGATNSIRFLLKNGADINAKDNEGRNALLLSVEYQKDAASDLLIESGIDINNISTYETSFKAQESATPFLSAVQTGNLPMAKKLLALGADLNFTSLSNTTPLIVAARNKDHAMMEFLLDNGANVNSVDKTQFSALYWTIFQGPSASHISKYLIQKGAKTDEHHNGGTTALLRATWNGDKEVVRMLLDKGDDVHFKNSVGATALKGALQRQDKELIEMLRAAGATE